MRWEALFDDLEGQLAQEEMRHLQSEVAERTRAERARITLAERLLAHGDERLRVALRSGELSGTLRDVAPQWLVLDEGPAQTLVPVASIVHVRGLHRAAAGDPGTVLRSLGLGHALRALARDRAGVTVATQHGALHGTIDRVGADHFDLAEHEPGQQRRSSAVRGVATVTFERLEWVRRGPG